MRLRASIKEKILGSPSAASYTIGGATQPITAKT
jgi:hypothetical protein